MDVDQRLPTTPGGGEDRSGRRSVLTYYTGWRRHGGAEVRCAELRGGV